MCERVLLPGGGFAIVCGGHARERCACGRRATRLCDSKVPGKKSGTCDAPVCARCGTSPAPGKDLCARHGAAFNVWQTERQPRLPLGEARP